MHTLLLRLAFTFALRCEVETHSVVIQRECNVWKNGIHWLNMDGVEAIVEVVEQNTAVVFVVGCSQGDEMACIKLQSDVIRTILQTKQQFCGAVEMRECLIDPKELLNYPLKCCQELVVFSVGRVATAIAEQKKYVTSKQGQHQNKISLTEILPHDPYVKLNKTFISYLFDQSHNENSVDEVFLRTHNMFEKVLQDIQVFDCRFVSDSTKNEGDTAIDIWKNQICCPTYGNLRAYLDQYSVFCGRNPLVGLCMWQQEHRLLLVYAFFI